MISFYKFPELEFSPNVGLIFFTWKMMTMLSVMDDAKVVNMSTLTYDATGNRKSDARRS